MFGRVGQAIGIVREERGWSQGELAERSGIGRSQVSKYEAGKELMKLETLEKILVSLGVEVDDFFVLVKALNSVLKPPEITSEAVKKILDAAAEKLGASMREFHDTVRAAALRGGAGLDGAGGEGLDAGSDLVRNPRLALPV